MHQFLNYKRYNFVAGDYEAVDKIKNFYERNQLDGFYYCNNCVYADKHFSNIRCHVESKHYSPGYPCSICGKVFKIRSSIRRHTKICNVKKCFKSINE